MNYHRKTYFPFIIWLIVFLILTILSTIIVTLWIKTWAPFLNKIVYLIVYLALLSLFQLMDRGGYVYWINGGPSYEQAKVATTWQRKEYTQAHLKLIKKATAMGILFLLLGLFFHSPLWLDTLLFLLVLFRFALKTIAIKF